MDFYCQVYVFLLLCAFSSVYSVSLCCCVFFACKYVLCYCQPVSTQLQLTNMAYHVTSYHIILLSTVVWKKVTLSYITIRVYESCENKIPAISFFFFLGAVHQISAMNPIWVWLQYLPWSMVSDCYCWGLNMVTCAVRRNSVGWVPHPRAST